MQVAFIKKNQIPKNPLALTYKNSSLQIKKYKKSVASLHIYHSRISSCKAGKYKLKNFFFRFVFIFALFVPFEAINANSLDFLTGKSTQAPLDFSNLQEKSYIESEQKREEKQQKQELEKLDADGANATQILIKKTNKGFFTSIWIKIKTTYYSIQFEVYKYVAELLTQIKTGDSNKEIWSLIFISFLYGVFHAAGPGHGKAVIATYLSTQNAKLKSGVVLAFFMAQAQAISAIFLVFIILNLVQKLSKALNKSLENMYFASALILVVLSIWLIFSSLKNLYTYFIAKYQAKDHSNFTKSCQENKKLTDAYAYSIAGKNESYTDTCASLKSHQDCTCNHSIDLADEKWQKSNFWQQFLIITSVGLRPCTGAIMILAFSKALNIWITGIIATFAMALGVGLTMILLAIFVVYFRDFATKMLKSEISSLQLFTSILKLLGAFLILLFAALLFTDTSATSIGKMLQ